MKCEVADDTIRFEFTRQEAWAIYAMTEDDPPKEALEATREFLFRLKTAIVRNGQ